MTGKTPATRKASNGSLLSIDAIVAKDDAIYEIVPMPEWGGDVRIRGLTARERDDYEASLYYKAPDGSQKVNFSGARERLVARGLVDAEGKRLLTDSDAGKLAAKNGKAMERLFDRIRELSGMTNTEIETMVGN